jgi:hypothetical protein
MTSNDDSPTARSIAEFRANAGQLGGSFQGVPVLLLHTSRADSGSDWGSPAHLPAARRLLGDLRLESWLVD